MVKQITNNDLSEALAAGRALLDFKAVWCGPCKMLAPIVDQVSEETKDVSFFQIDVDENEELAAQFGIMSIPTLVLLKDGREAARTVGLMPKAALEDFINQ